MEFRTLGRTGAAVSVVSLGTEYLINLPRDHVAGVIREAAARGVNYFDLFFAQPEFRDHLGAALRPFRRRVMLAAHLGATWEGGQGGVSRDTAACERFLNDFLTRYQTDYVDVLMLHNCDAADDYRQLVRPGGPMDLALDLKRQGKCRFIGFSGHTVETAQQAVVTGNVDVLMFSLNLASSAVPGLRDLLAACAARGVAVVAMKPYAGGKLLADRRTVTVERFQYGGEKADLDLPGAITPVRCLSYALTQPAVATVVPGCKDLDQLAAALAYLDATDAARDFSAVLSGFREYARGECVYCNHCLPCPAVIDIGQTIRLLDAARGRPPTPDLRAAYDAMEQTAADCTECGQCTERCPFGVDVVAKMERAAALFGE